VAADAVRAAGATTFPIEETSAVYENPSPIRVALFVDFDNVFLGLRDQDPQLAERFGHNVDVWDAWIRRNVPVPAGQPEAPREILLRRCYLNPHAFHAYRPAFTAAAYQVVDCPPLTRRGKTSSDVHMVIDILDTLGHPTHFDEFVLLSGDADFTPVLLRLRSHDRRTAVLAVGPSAAAYQRACDDLIDPEAFVRQALGSAPSRPATPGAKLRPYPAMPSRRLSESPTKTRPVGLNGGRQRATRARVNVPLVEFAERAHRQAGIPLLSPGEYAALFRAILRTVTEKRFALNETSREVRDSCTALGYPIGRHDVAFVLKGLLRAECPLRDPTQLSYPHELDERFVQSAKQRCEEVGMPLSAGEELLLRQWILGETGMDAPPVSAKGA
jgi:uncharacterized LabA/DUF88 family protein